MIIDVTQQVTETPKEIIEENVSNKTFMQSNRSRYGRPPLVTINNRSTFWLPTTSFSPLTPSEMNSTSSVCSFASAVISISPRDGRCCRTYSYIHRLDVFSGAGYQCPRRGCVRHRRHGRSRYEDAENVKSMRQIYEWV